jgi:uncharacterized protein (TIGR00730 family)
MTDIVGLPLNELPGRVAIFGSADLGNDTPEGKSAFTIARMLAARGVVVVDGGGPGIMLQATNGAHAGGGKAVTVTFAPTDAPFFEGKVNQNHGDEDFSVTNYFDRLRLLYEQSDAFVIMRGGTGTFSEWGAVWLMAHIHFGRHKPFVLFGSFWKDVLTALEKSFLLDETEMKVFRIVETEEEVLLALQDLWDARQK